MGLEWSPVGTNVNVIALTAHKHTYTHTLSLSKYALLLSTQIGRYYAAVNVTPQALERPPWENVFPSEPFDEECVECEEREGALIQRACVARASGVQRERV